MAAEILTREDLAVFKAELFSELREIITSHPAQPRKMAEVIRSKRASQHFIGNIAEHAYQWHAFLYESWRVDIL
jgi:hypothetical protein